MASKFIKKYNILYTIFSGEITKVSRELSQAMSTKKTWDTSGTAA